jgi:hypothetical protein
MFTVLRRPLLVLINQKFHAEKTRAHGFVTARKTNILNPFFHSRPASSFLPHLAHGRILRSLSGFNVAFGKDPLRGIVGGLYQQILDRSIFLPKNNAAGMRKPIRPGRPCRSAEITLYALAAARSSAFRED